MNELRAYPPSVSTVLLRSVAALLAFPAALALSWSSPFSLAFVGAPLLVIAWALTAFWFVADAFVAARAGDRRRALSLLLFPLLTAAAAANGGEIWGRTMQAGEYLHFRSIRNRLLEDIERLPDDGARLMLVNRGGLLISHGVIFDETDEILLPETDRSRRWKEKAAKNEIGCGVLGASPVGDHFYIVRLGC